MNIRRCLAASMLAAGLLTMTACGTEVAGRPVAAAGGPVVPATAQSTSSPSSTAAPTTPLATTDAPSTSRPSSAPSTAGPSTDDPGNDPTSDNPTSDVPTAPAGSSTGSSRAAGTKAVDAATKRWVTGMCTDMGAVYTAVLDVPQSTEASGLAAYRSAYVTYYRALHESAAQALGDAQGAQPPSVPGGADIHQTFVRYLTGLADLSGSAAELVGGETTLSDVSADILQVSHEMENLSTKVAGPTEIKSPELAAAVQAEPECADFGK